MGHHTIEVVVGKDTETGDNIVKTFRFEYMGAKMDACSGNNKVLFWRDGRSSFLRIVTPGTRTKPERDTLYAGYVQPGDRTYIEFRHSNSRRYMCYLEALANFGLLTKEEVDFAKARVDTLDALADFEDKVDEAIQRMEAVGIKPTKSQLAIIEKKLKPLKQKAEAIMNG